jgi:hypothetical protein
MEKLIDLINQLAEKYQFEQGDLDRIDQAILEISGAPQDQGGDDFSNPYGEEEDDGDEAYED